MNTDRFRLYDADALVPVVRHMARQIALLLDETPTVLLGVLRRGAPLADRLCEAVLEIRPDAALSRMDLLVKRYADDLTLMHPDTRLDVPADAGTSLRDRRVIVVDDVLYQGYSLFRVCEWLRSCKPSQIHTAVLVDRQRGCLPIKADIVGATLRIAPGHVIECNVPPYEPDFAVDVWNPGGSGK
jgi:pyrimidine operon attenuation protein/uracil phosphoribosyltransferase